MQLVLASSSPFRRTLMENAGLTFEAKAADIDERQIEDGLVQASPDEVAVELAKAKALDVSLHFPGAIVLGSDQTMSLGDRVYHKPKNRQEAREAILSLAGKTHRLNSAMALVRDGVLIWSHVAHAKLTVRPLSDAFVDSYLDKVGEKVFSSVGGYQIEGLGIQLFSSIVGDHFTIIGLPLLPLLDKLRELDVIDA